LKPVAGREPAIFASLSSHFEQKYPVFELLFGASDASDPALEAVRRLQRERPDVPARILIASRDAPNPKAAILCELAAAARYPVLLVNDSDIRVPPGYLRQAVAPLADPGVGLATCLYRAAGNSFPARFEALGISTGFVPSVLVARLMGVAEFALGSTMVFRAKDLQAAGGFEAIAGYLADDYQLGRRISDSGLRIELAPVAVETRLAGTTWGDVWRHQVRWARTIRACRPGGYGGYALTQTGVWALAAAAAGFGGVAAGALAIRMAAGVACAAVLGDRDAVRLSWLIPVRDVWGFAVWLAGFGGGAVEWRGQRLLLTPDGKIAGRMEP
jgi:ceramide glucosyltransferase